MRWPRSFSPAARASASPLGESGTSTQPVKRFSRFHCDWPCRSRISSAMALGYSAVTDARKDMRRGAFSRCDPGIALVSHAPDMIIVALFVTHWFLAVFIQSSFHHRYAAHRMFTMPRITERITHLLAWLV